MDDPLQPHVERALTDPEFFIEAHNPEPVIKPTDQELILALWAKVMHGDPSKADELLQQYPDF